MSSKKSTLRCEWKDTGTLRSKRAMRPAILSWLIPRSPRVSDEGIRHLEEYKYNPSPSTSLDRFLYRVWWEPVSELVPLNVAPNTITAIGAAIAISSGILLWIICPTLDDGMPRWAEILVVIMTLVYQTADAVDGLHARRTGAGSPLGEMMDHGCDAICLTSFTIGYCATSQLGLGVQTFSGLATSWLPWWLSQWEAWHTGQLVLGTGGIGITEIEMLVAFVHMCGALGGPELWKYQLLSIFPGFDNGLEFRHACVLIQVVVCSVLSTGNIIRTLHHTKHAGEGYTPALRKMWPMALIAAMCYSWPLCIQSPALAIPMIFALSAAFSRTAVEVVIGHTTKESFSKGVPLILLLPLLLLAGVKGWLVGTSGAVLVWICAVVLCLDCVIYIVDVVNEIATHLGIFVFSVKKKRQD